MACTGRCPFPADPNRGTSDRSLHMCMKFRWPNSHSSGPRRQGDIIAQLLQPSHCQHREHPLQLAPTRAQTCPRTSAPRVLPSTPLDPNGGPDALDHSVSARTPLAPATPGRVRDALGEEVVDLNLDSFLRAWQGVANRTLSPPLSRNGGYSWRRPAAFASMPSDIDALEGNE